MNEPFYFYCALPLALLVGVCFLWLFARLVVWKIWMEYSPQERTALKEEEEREKAREAKPAPAPSGKRRVI